MSSSDVKTIFAPVDEKKSIGVIRSQYYGDILDYTKREMSHSQSGWKGDLHKVASIPHVIVENFCLRNKISFSEFLADKKFAKMLLNDPALKYFRTKAGRI
jgi:hypothetical protein